MKKISDLIKKAQKSDKKTKNIIMILSSIVFILLAVILWFYNLSNILSSGNL